MKLSELGSSVKYTDFTKHDKRVLVDLFVSNPHILKQMHQIVFQSDMASLERDSINDQSSVLSSRRNIEAFIKGKKSRNQDSGLFNTPGIST